MFDITLTFWTVKIMAETYLDIDAYFVWDTEKAVLIDPDDGNGEVWVPRSVLHGGTDLKIDTMDEGDEHTFQIMDWFVRKNIPGQI